MILKVFLSWIIPAFLIIVSISVIDIQEVSGLGAPAISIEFAQPQQTATVTATEGDIVWFTGTVSITEPYDTDMQDLVVNLTGDAGG